MQLIVSEQLWRCRCLFPFAHRRTKTVLVIVDAVAVKFFAPERERSLASCAQINRRIVFVCDDFGENAADLQTRRTLAGRSVITFDGFVDAFESANLKRHLTGKFFKHVLEVLEIATDEELWLFGRDVERVILSIDGVGDFLYLRLETRDRFADRGKQTGTVNFRILQRADESVFHCPPMQT